MCMLSVKNESQKLNLKNHSKSGGLEAIPTYNLFTSFSSAEAISQTFNETFLALLKLLLQRCFLKPSCYWLSSCTYPSQKWLIRHLCICIIPAFPLHYAPVGERPCPLFTMIFSVLSSGLNIVETWIFLNFSIYILIEVSYLKNMSPKFYNYKKNR